MFARIAAERLVSVTLELGGKSPLIVFDDSDLDRAAPAAMSICRNVGQVCAALSRLLVQRGVYEDFVAEVGRRLRDVEPGAGLGPLTTADQFDKVQWYFAIAKDDGVRLVTGGAVADDGDLAKGRFAQPTLYADVEPRARVFREEIFGPVLTATAFDTEDDAVRLANDSDYGLLASVWTRDGHAGCAWHAGWSQDRSRSTVGGPESRRRSAATRPAASAGRRGLRH